MIQGGGKMNGSRPMIRLHRFRPTGGDKLVGMSNMDREIMIGGSNGGTGMIHGTLVLGRMIIAMDGSHGMADHISGNPAGRTSRMRQKQKRNRRQMKNKELEETAGGRRASLITEATRASSTHGTDDGDSRGIKTGKDYIPEFNGRTPMREYERRVRLFQANTQIHSSYQAGKLVERLTDQAWKATETLDIKSLKNNQGVDTLLQHLWGELEPLEFLRVFQTLNDFYRHFRRPNGQQFTEYDMDFRSQCQRLDEINAGITGVTRAYWFLEKAGLGPELRKQVVSAAGGCYEYAKLRAALVAIVPQVSREDSSKGQSSSHVGKHARPSILKKDHKVNVVEEHGQDSDQPGEDEEQREDAEEDDPDRLEEQAQVLMTEAARRRAQNEKGRGLHRTETKEQREARVAEMKSRMPCSACKAHGFTRYGHWHSDKSCPFYSESGKPSEPSKGVFAVSQEEVEESDDDFLINMVFEDEEQWVFSTQAQDGSGQECHGLALTDTCCARSVCGEAWMTKHLKRLFKDKIDFFVVDEKQYFRFGAGPRVESSYAAVIPVRVRGTSKIAFLRVSVITELVPLLVSRKALESLGAVLDLPGGRIDLKQLDTTTDLVTTKTGHIGFFIDQPDKITAHSGAACPEDLCESLSDDNCEVIFLETSTSRTGLRVCEPNTPPLIKNQEPQHDKGEHVFYDR